MYGIIYGSRYPGGKAIAVTIHPRILNTIVIADASMDMDSHCLTIGETRYEIVVSYSVAKYRRSDTPVDHGYVDFGWILQSLEPSMLTVVDPQDQSRRFVGLRRDDHNSIDEQMYIAAALALFAIHNNLTDKPSNF